MKKGSVSEKEIVKRLSKALVATKSAVATDKSGDYATALSRYREAIEIMEKEISIIPDEHHSSFMGKLNKYKKRVQTLERLLPSLTQNSKENAATNNEEELGPLSSPVSIPTMRTFFVEEKLDFSSSKLPELTSRRPFWVMKVLLQTICTGGFINPKVYVNKVVWYQSDAKFSAIQYKVSGLESLSEAMTQLLAIDKTDIAQICIQLESFCQNLAGIQNMLANYLSFIKQPKTEQSQGIFHSVAATVVRGGGRLKTHLSSSTTDTTYVELLQEVFQKGEVLESWYNHFEGTSGVSKQTILDFLNRTSDFFYNVLLAFVTRDLNMLLCTYMKKMSQLFLTSIKL